MLYTLYVVTISSYAHTHNIYVHAHINIQTYIQLKKYLLYVLDL